MDIWDGPGLAKEPVPARNILIITDGVFSMDGDIADIRRIDELGNTYDALVVVDDSHGTGVLGATGRGSVEHAGMLGQVDVITSTLGKAMGGATGGFTTGRREIIEILRQKSRPYLFSNTVAAGHRRRRHRRLRPAGPGRGTCASSSGRTPRSSAGP